MTINGKYFEEEGPAAKRPPRFSEDIPLKRGLTEPERAVTQAIAEYKKSIKGNKRPEEDEKAWKKACLHLLT